MAITIYRELVQGSDEWRDARCGLLTASEVKLIITPAKMRYASNDKERAHLFELAAQRVTRFVEPSYVSDDMLRGLEDEPVARQVYAENYAPVEEIGFVTNDAWGFILGASPDGFVGDDGEIQVKAPRQKKQLETIVTDTMPAEHVIQVQTGLLVTGRKWCDFVSYHGGMPMTTIRIHRDADIQAAIVEAAITFHEKLNALVAGYHRRLADPAAKLVPTERRVKQEIYA